MHTTRLASAGVMGLVAALVWAPACSRSSSSGTLRQEDIGFSMRVPAGWAIDDHAPDLCSRGEGTGMVLVEPADGQSFQAYVEERQREFGAHCAARRQTTVAGHPAVELVLEYPDQGSTALQLVIELHDLFATVSFTMPSAEFPAQAEAIRQAFRTVSLP